MSDHIGTLPGLSSGYPLTWPIRKHNLTYVGTFKRLAHVGSEVATRRVVFSLPPGRNGLVRYVVVKIFDSFRETGLHSVKFWAGATLEKNVSYWNTNTVDETFAVEDEATGRLILRDWNFARIC